MSVGGGDGSVGSRDGGYCCGDTGDGGDRGFVCVARWLEEAVEVFGLSGDLEGGCSRCLAREVMCWWLVVRSWCCVVDCLCVGFFVGAEFVWL